jgi:hypothetical protein
MFAGKRAQGSRLTLGAHNLLQGDNIFVVQPFQQLNLPDGGDGEALLLIVHPDLLQGNLVVVPQVIGKEDLPIGSFSYLRQFLVAAQTALSVTPVTPAC